MTAFQKVLSAVCFPSLLVYYRERMGVICLVKQNCVTACQLCQYEKVACRCLAVLHSHEAGSLSIYINIQNLVCCSPNLNIHIQTLSVYTWQANNNFYSHRQKLNRSVVAMEILQNDNLGLKEVEWLSAPTFTSTTEIKNLDQTKTQVDISFF